MPKFARESLPGQRGSFSDVPILGAFHSNPPTTPGAGIFYLCLICNISVSTCSVEMFVLLEGYALEHRNRQDIPCVIRWLDFNGAHVLAQIRYRRPHLNLSVLDIFEPICV
jgi:hypothetical protein